METAFAGIVLILVGFAPLLLQMYDNVTYLRRRAAEEAEWSAYVPVNVAHGEVL